MANTDVQCFLDWHSAVQIDFYQKYICKRDILQKIDDIFIRKSDRVVDRVVVDELEDLLDVVVDDVVGKGEEDCPLNFLEVDLGAELFEKVLVLVKADGEEVEKVADVHIVRQAEKFPNYFSWKASRQYLLK